MVGVVDPSEFKTIDKHISKKFKKLDYIFNTPHHFAPVGGNNEFITPYSEKVIDASSFILLGTKYFSVILLNISLIIIATDLFLLRYTYKKIKKLF